MEAPRTHCNGYWSECCHVSLLITVSNEKIGPLFWLKPIIIPSWNSPEAREGQIPEHNQSSVCCQRRGNGYCFRTSEQCLKMYILIEYISPFSEMLNLYQQSPIFPVFSQQLVHLICQRPKQVADIYQLKDVHSSIHLVIQLRVPGHLSYSRQSSPWETK